jgi:phage pi2 protein 07
VEKRFNCVNAFLLVCAIVTLLFCLALLRDIDTEKIELNTAKNGQMVTVSGTLTNIIRCEDEYTMYLNTVEGSRFSMVGIYLNDNLQESLEDQSVVTLTVVSDQIGEPNIKAYGIAIDGTTIWTPEQEFERWAFDLKLGDIFCGFLGLATLFFGVLALTYREGK